MTEVSRWAISLKILTLSMNEGVFGKVKNRLCMISGRNIRRVRLRWWKAQVPFVGDLSIMDSTRASSVKPGYGRFMSNKRVRNVRLHATQYHLCYVLSTQRRVCYGSSNHSKENQHNTSSGLQLAEAKRQRHLRFGGSWGGIGEIGQDNRYEIVIGGTQRRRKCDSISRRIRG